MNSDVALLGGGLYMALWLFLISGVFGVIIQMVYCWTIEYRGDRVAARSALRAGCTHTFLRPGPRLLTEVLLDLLG